jgi:hypothetical protein
MTIINAIVHSVNNAIMRSIFRIEEERVYVDNKDIRQTENGMYYNEELIAKLRDLKSRREITKQDMVIEKKAMKHKKMLMKQKELDKINKK